MRAPNIKSIIGVAIALLFIALHIYTVVIGKPYLPLLPIAVLVGLTAIYKPNWLIYLVVFSAPLSFNFEDLSTGGIGFYFPTEPILFGLLLLFVAKLLHKNPIPKKILVHPISILIYVQLIWMMVTCVTSTMPLVSIKFLVARLWFVVVLYFMVGKLLTEQLDIKKYIWLYMLPMAAVIVITVVKHAGHNFSEEVGHWIMWPFFKDHTSYGAVIAFLIPPAIAMLLHSKLNGWVKTATNLVFVILVVGLIFSYTRAAWLSLVISAVVWVFMLLRVRFKLLLAASVALLIGFFAVQDQLIIMLEKNNQDSSDNFTEHITSMTNISSDASNLERLNRWGCAIRMFADKPVFGFGPGTYMFQYAPFQVSNEKTIISTNLGDAGNAHSEYLGPLSEMGLIGGLSMLLLFLMVSQYAFNLYFRLPDKDDRIMVLGIYLGLLSYFVHGLLNNFLDTDKVSCLFWPFIVYLVIMDNKFPKAKLNS